MHIIYVKTFGGTTTEDLIYLIYPKITIGMTYLDMIKVCKNKISPEAKFIFSSVLISIEKKDMVGKVNKYYSYKQLANNTKIIRKKFF